MFKHKCLSHKIITTAKTTTTKTTTTATTATSNNNNKENMKTLKKKRKKNKDKKRKDKDVEQSRKEFKQLPWLQRGLDQVYSARLIQSITGRNVVGETDRGLVEKWVG